MANIAPIVLNVGPTCDECDFYRERWVGAGVFEVLCLISKPAFASGVGERESFCPARTGRPVVVNVRRRDGAACDTSKNKRITVMEDQYGVATTLYPKSWHKAWGVKARDGRLADLVAKTKVALYSMIEAHTGTTWRRGLREMGGEIVRVAVGEV